MHHRYWNAQNTQRDGESLSMQPTVGNQRVETDVSKKNKKVSENEFLGYLS